MARRAACVLLAVVLAAGGAATACGSDDQVTVAQDQSPDSTAPHVTDGLSRIETSDGRLSILAPEGYVATTSTPYSSPSSIDVNAYRPGPATELEDAPVTGTFYMFALPNQPANLTLLVRPGQVFDDDSLRSLATDGPEGSYLTSIDDHLAVIRLDSAGLGWREVYWQPTPATAVVVGGRGIGDEVLRAIADSVEAS
jgi:hypothetical protein